MIIDTEAHVFRFARSTYNNPANKSYGLHQQFTWREQPAELLAAEMDYAGVDKAFLISYDAEDGRWEAGLRGYSDEDFSGGRKYTLREALKAPDRFLWFNTIKDPKFYDSAQLVREDAELGMVGVKLFPAFLRLSLLEDGLVRVWDACRELDLRVLISFENIRPPETTSLAEYMDQLNDLASTYPDLKFALLHMGCGDPLAGKADDIFRVARAHSNIYLSGAYPGEVWDDGTEYPFKNYLARYQAAAEAVGANRLMWGTDWPWFDWAFKYSQGLNSIRLHADFLSDEEKALVIGGTAEEFMGSRINDQVKPDALGG